MRAPLLTLLLSILSTLANAQPGSVFIEDLTWPEVRNAISAGKSTAIYYAGSTEQNGPHMVLGKHNFIAHYVAGRVAEELGNALVYPILPFAPTGDRTKKTVHMKFPGTISISDSTFGAVAREVAESAIAAGFKNVVLMGDHGGGQEALKQVANDLDHEWASTGTHVFYVSDAYYKAAERVAEYLTQHGLVVGRHAGIHDTSELMFLDKDQRWIRHDQLGVGGEADGVYGDSGQASVELGERFIAIKITAAVSQIRRLIDPNK